MPASRVTALPETVYPVPENVSEWNGVPTAKSLVAVALAAPAGNSRSSPGLGATFAAQLAGVVQALVAPPPVQVARAGVIRSSSDSRAGRKAGCFRELRE